MKKEKIAMGDSSSSSGGGIGLVTLVSGIYAFCTTPEMTGLHGAFAAAMTGMGTSLEARLYAAGGAVVGGIGGGIIGTAVGKAKKVAALFALVGGLGMGIYGIPAGYHNAKDIVVDGLKSTITHTFNNSGASPQKQSVEKPFVQSNAQPVAKASNNLVATLN
jgi:hypothetical protein